MFGALLLAACASPRPAEPPDTGHPAGDLAYRTLADAGLHRGRAPAAGLYVRGRLVGEVFIPEGEVQGEGEFCASWEAASGQGGHPGWMELDSGTFYGAETARPPRPPYVEGCRGPDGLFRPGSRRVVY